MIVAENLKKSFKSGILQKRFMALDDISFSVPPARSTGFLGANGAGKTTLIKILFNFIFPDSGKVFFSKELGKSQSEILNNVGYLPERPYFYGDLTGQEFLIYLGGLCGLKRSQVLERSKKLGEELKIDHALARKISSYSKGMLQRIGFLSAIIHNPKLLILDEPMAGLDPLGRSEFKNLFYELEKQGKSLFFSSHIVSDIEEICQNLVVLQKGKLLFAGETKELMNRHLSEHFLLKTKSSVEWLENSKYKEFYKVKRNDKDEIIRKILQEQIGLEYLVPDTPSLEKIVYQLEQHEL